MGSEILFGIFFIWVFMAIAVYKDWFDKLPHPESYSYFHRIAIFIFILWFWWGTFII